MKKLSKRLISVLLAALLIVSSVPLFAVTAMAADLTTLESAIDAYEDKMANVKTGTIYTNMQDAYDKYVIANEYYDAATYGTFATQGDIDTAAGNLYNATTAMEEWTAPTYYGQPIYYFNEEAKGGAGGSDDAYYSHVVFGYPANTSSDPVNVTFTGETNVSYTNYKYILPTGTVLVYDGTTEADGKSNVYVPMGMETKMTSNRDGTIGYTASTTSSWAFQQEWLGRYSGVNNVYQLWYGGHLDSGYNNITFGYQTSDGSSNTTGANGNTGTSRFWINKLRYTGTGNTTNYYELFNSFSFQTYIYQNSALFSSAKWQTSTASISIPIYVVNYKPIKEGIDKYVPMVRSAVATTNGVADYSETGGLSALFGAMDQYTKSSLDPYDTATYGSAWTTDNYASNAQKWAANIKASATDPNATVGNQNGSGYTALRTWLTNTKATYDAAIVNDGAGYTSESWSAFKTAYEAGVTHATWLPTNGYNNSTAQTYADAIEAAWPLETVAAKVDTTPVENLVTQFRSYNNIFTPASYAAVEAAINAASQAIWNGNYGVAADALDDSAEAQATVEQHRAAIDAAIKGLRISPDAVVQTSNMRMSMNQALALDVDDPSDYANYAVLTTAKNEAQTYLSVAAITDFTDYDAQYAQYVAAVQAVFDAYSNLQYSFLKIPDGTVANTGALTAINMDAGYPSSSSGGFHHYFYFSYPSSGIIIKMNHEVSQTTYGTAYLTHTINLDGNTSKNNNGIDSVTIKATTTTNTEINSTAATSTQSALSDAQKETYAGLLYDQDQGFGIRNFHVIGTRNRSYDWYALTDLGTEITDRDSAEYDQVLGYTTGTSTCPAYGTSNICVASSGDASLEFAADMYLDLPGSVEPMLTATTLPTQSTVSFTNNYFGITYTWNIQPVLAYAGYGFVRSDEPMTSNVTIVDAANLVDLIALVKQEEIDANHETLYTIASWNNFLAAYSDAQMNLNYTEMTANEITEELQTRYTNLWNAYKALVRAATNQPIKDTLAYQAADKPLNVQATYEAGASGWSTATWADFAAAYEAATGTDGLGNKYSDINIRNYNTTEQPAIDNLADTLKATYEALLANIPVLPAIEAFEALTEQLADYSYYATDLQAVNTALAGMQYYAMDRDAVISADYASDLQGEITTLETLTAQLKLKKVTGFYEDSFQYYVQDAKRKASDPDAYDVDEVVDAINELETAAFIDVTVTNADTYKALAPDAQQLVDQAEARVQSIPLKEYTVTVDNADAVITDESGKTYANGAKIPYGTMLTVSVDEGACFTYDYESYTANKEKSHHQKYIGTVEEFTFKLVGNTTVTAAAATDDKPYKVSYVTTCKDADEKEQLGYTVAVQYVNEGGTVDTSNVKAPAYAFYSYQGMDAAPASITKDTKIYLNYEQVGEGVPMCTVYNFDEGSETEYYYGEIVTESLDDSAVAVAKVASEDIADYFYEGIYIDYPNYPFKDDSDYIIDTVDPFLTVVAYGNTYTFKITEEAVYLVSALSDEDILVCAEPVYDNAGAPSSVYVSTHATVNEDTIITNSSFAMPEGYELVEAGVLVQYNKTGEVLVDRELSFDTAGAANDVGADKIRRLKSTKLDSGTDNSYTINLHLNSATGRAKYVAYINYTDDQGAMHTVFSATQDAVIG